MLFFLENLVDLPKVKIRNVIQEGTEAFLVLSRSYALTETLLYDR